MMCDQPTGNATPPLPSVSLSVLEKELLGFGSESEYEYGDSFSDSNSDDGWRSDNPPREVCSTRAHTYTWPPGCECVCAFSVSVRSSV